MTAFNLSRLQITGNLTPQTPICVLTEIARSHGIPYNEEHLDRSAYHRQLVELIGSTRIRAVVEPYDHRSYPYIARFVNLDCEWRRDELEQAFTFLRRYTGAQGELPLNPDFEVGPQTPNKPLSLNACVLYKLCLNHNITVHPNTTLKQMATSIRFFIQPVPFLRQFLLTQVDQLPRENLVNMMNYLTPSQNAMIPLNPNTVPTIEERIEHDRLEQTQTLLSNTTNLYRRINPENSAEAIVLGATIDKIDLSKFDSPLNQYRELSVSRNGTFLPTEEKIRRIVLKNPNFLRLDHNFNPLIPVGLYSADDLRRMANAEGYLNSDFIGSSPYELLQLSYLSYTFFPGLHDNVMNRETPITFDPLDELDNDSIICFGSKSTGELTAFRYSELADSFRINKNFVNPIQIQSRFDDLAIRKLKLLALEQNPNHSPDVREERRRLYNAIIETEIFAEETNVRLREFFELYNRSEEEKRIQIREALRLILEMGMYMRGWTGAGSYPVTHAPHPIQDEVDERVSNAMRRFEEACLELNEIGTLIKSLPLFNYRDGFVASTDRNQGFTLQERVDLVREGDTTNNIYSCIRMSSNWICYSAYRYMQVVGMDPPFVLDALINIT